MSEFDLKWEQLKRQAESGEELVVGWVNDNARWKVMAGDNCLIGKRLDGFNTSKCVRDVAELAFEKLKGQVIPRNEMIRAAVPQVELGADCGFVTSVVTKLNSTSAINLLSSTEKNITSRYVLIIDEINRGNISKILGELITLLEEDKRIGRENELWLTLPTTQKLFSLPDNLYILGTMNTSDKSLAQLDIALRRRFDTKEMAPDFSHCSEFLRPVLNEFNNRLEWALDREHRLGHAYFMNVKSEDDFNAVFQSKILPLLLEYFPRDFQTLRAVLGEKTENGGFLREMKKPDGFSGGGKKYRWWFEGGDAGFSAFAQLKLNYGL